MALGGKVLAAQAGPQQERRLRVRPGGHRRRLDPVQARLHGYLYAIILSRLRSSKAIFFLLPFAVAFTGLSLAACIAMLVFLLLLLEGLVWAWQKNVLVWA